MKKVVFAGAVAALSGTSASVYAQSSVTLYGLLDAGVGYVRTHSGSEYALVSGNIAGDRWGLKGQEDLGGGLTVVFQIENGFNIANGKLGQGGRMFGRQSMVGLADNRLGTVKVGRGYDPVVDLVQGLTADVYGSAFATPGDVDNNDNSARVSNQVKYISPSYAGLQFEAMYAFSGVAGQAGQGNTYAGAVSYTNGPFDVAAGYFQATNSGSAGAIRSGWTSPTADSTFDGDSINAGYASAHTLQIAQVAGRYRVGAATLGTSYGYVQYRNDASSVFHENERFNSGKAYAAWQFTPAFRMAAGYIYTAADGDTDAHYHQASLGAYYDLSVRTELYAIAAYERAAGTQRTVNGGTQQAVAAIGSYGIDGGPSQTMALLGIHHRF
ncbi:porin [Burkholderia multivorans]|uniref:porin n=1 Tax=Burkholderia multivorans TaxID=87883 RepID=UPI001C25B76F|nr:porin [Burkholderia multivorans]MBU9576264.1 porin [Burkholderia multivorans]MDN7953818.1 porin [Burkholderia multivorans]MDN7999959.1 porin [Burkholderia multivorans]